VRNLGALASRRSGNKKRSGYSEDSKGPEVSWLPQHSPKEATMSWYAAHIIMFVELREGSQKRFPVWENVVLIKAKNEDEAFEKAEHHGRAEEGDDGGSFRWGKIPARWVFAGVRKLTECDVRGDEMEDGAEETYNEFELESRQDVMRLAEGKRVQAFVNDRYREAARKTTKERESKQAKRKRA